MTVAAVLAVAATTVPAAADGPQPSAACVYSYLPLKGANSYAVVSETSGDRARVVVTDYVQVAESVNCLDRVRSASTIRCYTDYNVPVSCRVYGYTILQNTTTGSWEDIQASVVNFDVAFGGSTSVYGGYRDRYLCVSYRSRLVVPEVQIDGVWYAATPGSTASNPYLFCEA